MKQRKPMGSCKKCDHRPHATPCRICSCQYETALPARKPRSPMPKATKPIKARNQQRRPAAAATAQREAVMERDRGRCVFMYSGFAFYDGGIDIFWLPCCQPATDTAHVFRRRHCGKAVYDPDVAVAACRFHHEAYDQHRREGIRLPEYAIERARAAINAVVLPENRLLAEVEA